MAKKVKQFLDKIKKDSESFRKKAITKYKKDIIGMILMPPRPQDFCPECESKNIKIKDKKATCTDCKNKWNTLDILTILKLEGTGEQKYKKEIEIRKQLNQLAAKNLPDVNINTIPIEKIWDMANKGKYDFLNLISVGVAIHDSEWLRTLRGVEMHKMMVLKKFEKYVVTYIVAGSMIRGDAKKGSDVDVYVVIDDTDVTRLTSRELQQKLRHHVSGMAWQAKDAVKTDIVIHPQVWLLSDMWDSFKNASPVIVSVVRDGVSFYDRGMFVPWKILVAKGKVAATPEAVDSYLKTGTSVLKKIRGNMRDMALDDFFWATITPTQGALMMVGFPPPGPKETIAWAKEHFVKKKLLEPKYLAMLEKIYKLRKDVEHGTIKQVPAKVITERLKDTEDYLKRMDKLFKTIEVQQIKKEISELYEKTSEDTQAALKLMGVKASKTGLVEQFNKNIVKKKLAPSRYLAILKQIDDMNKTKKADRRMLATIRFEQDRFAKEVFELIRAEKGENLEKFKLSILYNKKKANLWLLEDKAFLIKDINNPSTQIIKYKLSDKGLTASKKSGLRELNNEIKKFQGKPTTMSKAVMQSLSKELGSEFEILIGA